MVNFIILLTALGTGIVHTLLGPDHYLPFAALAKAEGWPRRRTLRITLLCGLGHVLSAAALGTIGLQFLTAAQRLQVLESARGGLAAWALIAFGLVYLIAGLRQQIKNKTSKHVPGILLAIFLLGPCEPLIPLIVYPAIGHDPLTLFAVIGLFGAGTIATMLAMVFALTYGWNRFMPRVAARHATVLAGTAILICGLGMKIFGW